MGKKWKQNRSDLIFETTDRFNTIVYLSSETWYEHILPGHPEMEDYLEDIQRSIESPHIISQRETSRLYRLVDAGKGVYAGLYLTSVLDLGGVGGRVATAYFEDELRSNEEILWVDTKVTLRPGRQRR